MKNFLTYSIITVQNFALFIFSILAIIFYNCFNLDFYKLQTKIRADLRKEKEVMLYG